MRDVIAVRGATTVDSDDKCEIVSKTVELVNKLIEANGIDGKKTKCVSMLLSTTKDIKSYYPATAVRESGILSTALMSCLEPDIDGSLPLCIRVLITLLCEEGSEPKHIYLHGAKALRPDITYENQEKVL